MVASSRSSLSGVLGRSLSGVVVLSGSGKELEELVRLVNRLLGPVLSPNEFNSGHSTSNGSMIQRVSKV